MIKNSLKFLAVLVFFTWVVTEQLYTQKYIGDACSIETYSSIHPNVNPYSENSRLSRQKATDFPCYDKVREERKSAVNIFYQGKGTSFSLQKTFTGTGMAPPEYIVNNYSYKNVNTSELIYLLNNSFLI